MTRPIKIVHNAQTGEIIEREYNDEEMVQHQLDLDETVKIQNELQVKENKKQALLAKLGITEEEAKLLLS